MNEMFDKFSLLFPTEDDARRIVYMAGLPQGNIKFNTTSKNRWFYIFQEAEKHPEGYRKVIEMAHSEYPNDDLLALAIEKDNKVVVKRKESFSARIKKASSFDVSKFGVLLANDKLSEALSKLSLIGDQLTQSFKGDVIAIQGRLTRLEQDNFRGVIRRDDYILDRNKISESIKYLVNQIDDEQEVLDALASLSTDMDDNVMDNLIVETDSFEKQIGNTLDFHEVQWYEQAAKASKSVCLVKLRGGGTGTGWIINGNYLITNKHVIPNEKVAGDATITFNYQIGGDPLKIFNLNPDKVFYTSVNPESADGTRRPESEVLDYTLVSIEDDGSLDKFGSLNLGTRLPLKGELVNIIQHPGGGVKKLAMLEEVSDVSDEKNRLYYQVDTLAGSSGSPVFNQDWQVVALHNAATSRNSSDRREDANKGVLIQAIVEDLRTKGLNI